MVLYQRREWALFAVALFSVALMSICTEKRALSIAAAVLDRQDETKRANITSGGPRVSLPIPSDTREFPTLNGDKVVEPDAEKETAESEAREMPTGLDRKVVMPEAEDSPAKEPETEKENREALEPDTPSDSETQGTAASQEEAKEVAGDARAIKTQGAAKLVVPSKDEGAKDSTNVKLGSVLYVPFFGPCNQLVNALTASWIASLVPGSRVKVLNVKRHFSEQKKTNVTQDDVGFAFSKEDVFSDAVLSQSNFSIDRLTHLVGTGQPRSTLLSDLINSKGEFARRYFMHFQEMHGLPDDLPVDVFVCKRNENKIECYKRALKKGRNVLVAHFNECLLRPMSIGKPECESLYNFMKGDILRNPPLPSGTPQFEASIQLRFKDFRSGLGMQQNFKDVHYASQYLHYNENFTTSQLIDTLLEVYRGNIYITFPPTRKLDEYIATKTKGEKRIYTPQDFDADMLLDQTLAASATTFISDSHSTYSVIMDARRPLNSSIVSIDKWITMHSNATWVGDA